MNVFRHAQCPAIAVVLWQMPPARPRPQGPQPHQTLDSMQSTFGAFRQQIVPDPTRTIGSEGAE
jgi:hypothetical protein